MTTSTHQRFDDMKNKPATDTFEGEYGSRNKWLCFYCQPPKPETEHKTLDGVIIHERDDCPPDTIYMLNESSFNV